MTGSGYATPLCRKLAAQHGVDLTTLSGSGVAGRVTADDVRRAAGVPTHADQRATAAIRQVSRPAVTASTRRVPSAFARIGAVDSNVELDVMGRNPLLEDLQKSDGTTYARAVRNNADVPPPTLFAGGDLPVMCASGIDPSELMRLPWVARHPAAAEPDRGKVAAIFEACAGDGQDAWNQAGLIGLNHRGNRDYTARMKTWAEASPAYQREQMRAGQSIGSVTLP
jgi:2-oxoacid dehydrogenase-like protein with E3 subunit-binding domain